MPEHGSSQAVGTRAVYLSIPHGVTLQEPRTPDVWSCHPPHPDQCPAQSGCSVFEKWITGSSKVPAEVGRVHGPPEGESQEQGGADTRDGAGEPARMQSRPKRTMNATFQKPRKAGCKAEKEANDNSQGREPTVTGLGNSSVMPGSLLMEERVTSGGKIK